MVSYNTEGLELHGEDIFLDDYFSEELTQFELNQFLDEDISVDEYSEDISDEEISKEYLDEELTWFEDLSNSLYDYLYDQIEEDPFVDDLSLANSNDAWNLPSVYKDSSKYVIVIPFGGESGTLSLKSIWSLNFHLQQWIDLNITDSQYTVESGTRMHKVDISPFGDGFFPFTLKVILPIEPKEEFKRLEERLEQSAQHRNDPGEDQ